MISAGEDRPDVVYEEVVGDGEHRLQRGGGEDERDEKAALSRLQGPQENAPPGDHYREHDRLIA